MSNKAPLEFFFCLTPKNNLTEPLRNRKKATGRKSGKSGGTGESRKPRTDGTQYFRYLPRR